MIIYEPETVKTIQHSRKIAVYGARIVAAEVAYVLLNPPYNIDIDCFLVTSRDGNPSTLLGLPVYQFDEVKEQLRDALILIAVLEKHVEEIRSTLIDSGISDYIFLTFESDLWGRLRANSFAFYCKTNGRVYRDLKSELSKGNGDNAIGQIHVYRAICHLDKPIREDMSPFDWEIPIQVGSELTEQRIAKVCDSYGGDSISSQNRKYCELTALYWVWKHDHADYKGLCHYRRHFVLSSEERYRILSSGIDVIVTYPIVNYPNVKMCYYHDHDENDWEKLKDIIKIRCPEYEMDFQVLENSTFYYAFNMMMARKEVFDDYCSWLFPLLDEVDRQVEGHADPYQNRFIGFRAERLINVDWLHHS